MGAVSRKTEDWMGRKEKIKINKKMDEIKKDIGIIKILKVK